MADTGASHYPEAPKNIKVWDIVDGKRLSGGREFTSMELNGKAGFARRNPGGRGRQHLGQCRLGRRRI